MTKVEFKLKVEEAFMEFNKDKNFDFLLVAIDRNDNPGPSIIIGFGCGACQAEEIAANLDKFKHEEREIQIG